ncbi:MAG: hypothetical protein VX728_04585, partial [Actinomycetota bacterium]|nr:hypothetical protein [Actinomycetota bacterium]
IDRRCCWGVATTLLREPDRTYSASKHNMVTHPSVEHFTNLPPFRKRFFQIVNVCLCITSQLR